MAFSAAATMFHFETIEHGNRTASMNASPSSASVIKSETLGNRGSSVAEQFDIRRWINAFRRRLRLFGAIVVTILVFTIVVTMNATPKYTATAAVMLDTRKAQVTDVKDVLSGPEGYDTSSVVDTEVEVLKSRQLAERVVRALDLENDPEFNPSLRKPTGVAALKQNLKRMFGGGSPRGAPLSPLAAQKQHEGVVDAVMGGLQVSRQGLTYVMNVGYESVSPAKAAIIANKWAELYLLEQMEAKFDATDQATKWLNGRIQALRGQVQRDEAEVQQYKIANNLLSASGATLTEQEISNYNLSLAQARAQVAEDEARLNTARQQLARGSTGEDVGEALGSPVIQDLRRQRSLLSAQMADLNSKYGPRHPELLKAQRQLEDIDVQIKGEIERIVSNLQAKVQVSRERAGAISGSLGGARGALEANSRAMVRLGELQRNADASRTIYESYLKRFQETSTQEGAEKSDARVVSRAKIPLGQSSPKVNLNLALGLVIALGAGLGAVILAEMLDAGLATAEEVERSLGVAFLGGVPMLASVTDDPSPDPLDFVVRKPLSSFSEAFRNLRTSLMYSRLGQPVKVVAITSALPGEGKTTTAICLARTAALQGSRVIIVDCDLRRRTVEQMLDFDPEVGLLEVLNGDATLSQAIKPDLQSGADVLPLSKASFTPRDVFGSEAVDELLKTLRNTYDLVVLDTAPLLPVTDARLLAPKADVVMFLARWRKTPKHAIESAFRMLENTGAYLAGVALTQIDMDLQVRYGYGDPGYYYHEYRKYYADEST